MVKRKNKAIVYLSVEGEAKQISYKEEKQLRFIREYAKAHKIEIVKIVHRDVLGKKVINEQFNRIVKEIESGVAEVVLIAKSLCIALSIYEAYSKAGMVAQAGGKLVTVKEGILNIPIRMAG